MAILSKQYTLGDVMNIDSGRQERASGCVVKLSNVYHELKDETHPKGFPFGEAGTRSVTDEVE